MDYVPREISYEFLLTIECKNHFSVIFSEKFPYFIISSMVFLSKASQNKLNVFNRRWIYSNNIQK